MVEWPWWELSGAGRIHVEQETDLIIHINGVIHNTRCSKNLSNVAKETRLAFEEIMKEAGLIWSY